MLWFKKRKERKRDAEFFDIKNDIEMNRALGAMSVCVPIESTEIKEMVKNWCDSQGYKMTADHITDDVIFYKINGWD